MHFTIIDLVIIGAVLIMVQTIVVGSDRITAVYVILKHDQIMIWINLR